MTTILTAPAAEGTATTETTATFTFVADQANVTYVCSLDGADPTPCTSPVTYSEAQLAGPELGATAFGEHTFEVQATNPTSTSRTRRPAAPGSSTTRRPPRRRSTPARPGPPSNPTVTLTFSANELDTAFQCSLDGALFTGCASPLEIADLGLGAHTFEVYATDSAGNVDTTPAERTWTVVIPPTPNTPAGTDVQVDFTTPAGRQRDVRPGRASPASPRSHQSAPHRPCRPATSSSAPPTTTSRRRPSTRRQ